MNRILFEAGEIGADRTVRLADQRADHIREVLHGVPGQTVKTGTLNGLAGRSSILSVTGREVLLEVSHDETAPAPWFDLLLAVPRPKVLKRLWAQLAALGVGRVVLVNAYKVEKCYFSSQWLSAEHYRPLLIEGLTQGGLTQVPEVRVCNRFKPFVEDELDVLFPEALRLLAHPGPRSTCLDGGRPVGRPLMAVGPEGGWTDYEVDMLLSHGFQPFSLGERTLRTDTACVALIAVLEFALNKGES